jgi:hypothetical protein
VSNIVILNDNVDKRKKKVEYANSICDKHKRQNPDKAVIIKQVVFILSSHIAYFQRRRQWCALAMLCFSFSLLHSQQLMLDQFSKIQLLICD